MGKSIAKKSGKADGAGKRKKRVRSNAAEDDAADKRLRLVLMGADDADEAGSCAGDETEGGAGTGRVVVEENGHDGDGGTGAGAENGDDEEIRAHVVDSGAVPKPNPAVAAAASGRLMGALSEAHSKKVHVTVLLENANLEAIKQAGRSGGFVLLNCDDHRHILKKTGREANDARPDILHQCLLTLMDSPLNKAGRLKVYVRTAKNVLIEIHPQTRIPRTIRRFSGLMVELLQKFKVRGTSGSTPLLRVIRNPLTSHLPVGTRKIVCTYNCENLTDIREHAARMADLAAPSAVDQSGHVGIDDEVEPVNILYVVGAMAHGKIEEDWSDESICISEYPLSAATVCARITHSYECLLGIL